MDGVQELGVTVRELSRCAAALLDEVEKTGRRIIISRYGRATAILAPITEDDLAAGFRRWHVPPRYEQLGRETTVAPETDDVNIELLDDQQIEVLRTIGEESPDWWTAPTAEEFKRAVLPATKLEFADLVEVAGGLFRITPRGLRALDRLKDAGR